MKVMRLIMVLLFVTTFSNALHAGEGGESKGVGAEHECDHTAVLRLLYFNRL